MRRTNDAVRRLSPILRRLNDASEEDLRVMLSHAGLMGREFLLPPGEVQARLKTVAGQLAMSQAVLAREEAARRQQIDAELPGRSDIHRLLARELRVKSLQPPKPETDLFHIARKISLCLDCCEGDSSTTALIDLYEAGVAGLADVAVVMDRIGAYTTGKPPALTITTGATSMDQVVRAPDGEWRRHEDRPIRWDRVNPLSRSLFTPESLQKDFDVWRLSTLVRETRVASGSSLPCNPYEFPEELYTGNNKEGYPPISLLDWDDPNVRVAGALARSWELGASEQRFSSGAHFRRAVAAAHRDLAPLTRVDGAQMQ